jgi:hypothetical protein
LERYRCCSKYNDRNAHYRPNSFERNAIGYGSQDGTGEDQLHTLADPPPGQEAQTRGADRLQSKYQSAPYDRPRYCPQTQSRSGAANVETAEKEEQPRNEYEERQIAERDAAERVFRRKQERTRLSVETRK